MAGRKRSGSEAGVTTRGGSKAVKTDSTKPTSKSAAKPASKAKGAKRGPKAPATASFKSRALPLHVNVTHTPPSIPDEKTETATHADPGFLGGVTLVPSTFSTGSYGWKGTKRFAVELEDHEGGEGKEKVQVMLTINATVIGSKGAKSDAEDGDEEKEEEKEKDTADEEPATAGNEEE